VREVSVDVSKCMMCVRVCVGGGYLGSIWGVIVCVEGRGGVFRDNLRCYGVCGGGVFSI